MPEINTVLFLRPTESLTVFLQQLGRGLRHSSGKDYLQVLDFVAQMHRRYRVDRKFAALLPGNRYNIEKEIEHGFPHVPPGCAIHLEKQAMAAVLKNIRAAYANLRTYIPETIKTFAQDTGRELSLKNYLEVHAIEPERCLVTAPGPRGRPPRAWYLRRRTLTWPCWALPWPAPARLPARATWAP